MTIKISIAVLNPSVKIREKKNWSIEYKSKIFWLLFTTFHNFVQFNVNSYERRINKIEDSFDFEFRTDAHNYKVQNIKWIRVIPIKSYKISTKNNEIKYEQRLAQSD